MDPDRCSDLLAEDAGTAHLDPSDPVDVHFRIKARLCVWVIRGLEADALESHAVVELAEDPEQVSKRDVLVHHDPLELLELGKVGGVDGLAPVHPADRECLDRWFPVPGKVLDGEARREFTVKEVQKIAGQAAFWLGPDPDGVQTGQPSPGMSIEDLFTLCNITIKAGTTGNPKTQADQQAWSTILPLIRQFIGEIEQALAMGNLPMVKALTALIQETMKRMGDDDDVDRFIPKQPPPGSPGSGAPPQPQKPPVSVSLRGELSPQDAALLVAPDLPAGTTPTPAPPQPGAAGAAPTIGPPGPSTPIPPQPGP
jgi:hypothetical protein